MRDGIPRPRMFAGPNGSGKSTIKNYLKPHWFGVYLNADDLEREMRESLSLDVSRFASDLDAASLLKRIGESGQSRHESVGQTLESAHAKGATLSFDGNAPDSYFASALVEVIREHLLERRISRSFETVMSHPSKIETLRRAQALGFRTYLYFVATRDPRINVARVAARRLQGGHDVPEDKIRERYDRSMKLLADAARASTRAFIFDNTGDSAVLILELTESRGMKFEPGELTEWIYEFLLLPLLNSSVRTR